MRILALTYNRTDAGAFYRASGVFPDLRRKMDVDIDLKNWDEIVIDWQILLSYDVLFMFRPFTKTALSLAGYAKSLGVPLWVDYDDNLFVVPAENKHVTTYTPEVKENIKQLLRLADVVTVTTEPLKEAFKEFADAEVIPNAFNDYIFPKRQLRKERSPIVLWRGSESHVYDVMVYQDSIEKVMKEFPQWQFIFMGMYPWMISEAPNLYHAKDQDIMIYHQKCLNMGLSVLQVPLNNTPFNQSKSNIAFIEASYFGAVSLVPITWDVPALKYDTPDSYYGSLSAVLRGEVDIEAGNRKAWEYVCDNLFLSKVNVKRIEILNQL